MPSPWTVARGEGWSVRNDPSENGPMLVLDGGRKVLTSEGYVLRDTPVDGATFEPVEFVLTGEQFAALST